MSQQYPHDPNQQPPFQPAQKPPKKPMSKEAKIGWIIFAGLGAVALVASALIPDSANDDTANATKPSTVVTSVDNGPTPDPITTPTNKPTATEGTGCDLNSSPEEYSECLDGFVNGTTATPKPTKTTPAMTASQEQAISSAESYLSFTAFSRKGLIRQLSSDAGEGFSVADATYAVDHIKVNWNEQAAKKAKEYLQMQSFSRKGLIRQLESSAGEGFTHAQAVYGVNKAGL